MRNQRGVSRTEVIIGLVAIGLVAAFTIPRLGQAGQVDDPGDQLRRDLQVLRVAIERYYQDHNVFPGRFGDGVNPAESPAAVLNQLTSFSDEFGRCTDTPDDAHRFGPYLRDGFPLCATLKHTELGILVISGPTTPAYTPQRSNTDWVYNCDTGRIIANSNDRDTVGRLYASY